MDRARADNDLRRLDLFTGRGAHADCAAAVEQNPIDEHVASDGEVRTGSRRLEVRVVGRHPAPFTPHERPPAHTSRLRRVVVVARRIAEVGERGSHRPVHGGQLVEGEPCQRDGAAPAVQPVTAVINVVLDHEERLEHFGPAPPRATELAHPTVVVLDRPPDTPHGVDRRGASNPPPSPIQRFPLAGAAPRYEVVPQAPWLIPGLEEVHRPDPSGRLRRRVIRPGLEQQD